MAPERNLTGETRDDLLQTSDRVSKTSAEEEMAENTTTSTTQIAEKTCHETAIVSQDNVSLTQQTEEKTLDNILLETMFNSTSTTTRTESTATDDSGIAAEFDTQYQNLIEEDGESVLGNSQNSSLKSSTDSFNAYETEELSPRSATQENLESPRCSSPTKTMRLDLNDRIARTPEKQRLSEEDCSSPRQRWWSPHRAVCSESLDSIAEEKRRRSKSDITKRTAWLKERTESALEKSALVRKRSAKLIQTGKRLRDEEV